jgi:hypothetical protein
MNWIVTQYFLTWVGDHVHVGPFTNKDKADSTATHLNENYPLVDGHWVTKQTFTNENLIGDMA